jgi:hypothetical protein
MKRTSLIGLAALLLLCVSARPAPASAIIEALDLTGFRPSPIPGQVIAIVQKQFWDPRCSSVQYKVNTTLDPIPNPLGAPVISVADATPVLQRAAQAWTNIETSFIDLRVEGTSNNPGAARFDQVNEIMFRTDPGSFVVLERGTYTRAEETSDDILGEGMMFIRRTVLLADVTFSGGEDLDRDGDVDVSTATPICQDLDGDGDTEFPAGFYRAGTLFDTDIQFVTGADTRGAGGPPGVRFTVDPADIDDNPRSVDLYAVALQTFGLAQSIGHSMINQKSDRDGSGSMMFPFIDTGSADAERAVQELDIEAISTASAIYPEGSAETGPAALQAGDVAFNQRYGVITGEIRMGERGQPLIGASVFAVDRTTGEMVTTTISGTSRWSTLPTGFGARFLDPAWHVMNGNYRLVVPPGIYEIGVEPTEDQPAGHRHFNVHTIEAFDLLLDRFNEEFYSGDKESALERQPNHRGVVVVRAGETVEGIDIVINETRDLANFGTYDSTGFADAAPGTYYAVRFPVEQFLQADAAVGGGVLHGGAFLTAVKKTLDVPVFAEALLTTGRVNPDGTAVLDLEHPLAQQKNFAGQEFDFTPFYFENPVGLAQRIRTQIARGAIDNLFLVLRLPQDLESGPTIGLDGGGPNNDQPIYGLSYTSTDGQRFVPSTTHNFMFKLLVGKDPKGR